MAPEIAAIAPSLRLSYSDIPPLSEVPADQQRRLIFGGFLEYLQRGTQKSPMVILLDDLRRAAESTLQIREYVALLRKVRGLADERHFVNDPLIYRNAERYLQLVGATLGTVPFSAQHYPYRAYSATPPHSPCTTCQTPCRPRST